MLAFTTGLLLSAMPVQASATPPAASLASPPAANGLQSSDPVPPTPQATPTPPVEKQAPASAPVPIKPRGLVRAPHAKPQQQDIVVVGRERPITGDPLRAANAESFSATQAVDSAVVGPVARAYKRTVPTPIQKGIHNFLYNLREPVVFVNFLLQLKPGKAAETAGRFLINSTVGAAGLLDVAKRKPFRLPRRSNGFANTLGYHGVGNGPFLFLPLVGPTTVRDLVGGSLDRLVLPLAFGKTFTRPEYTVPAAVLGALDHRAEFDETLEVLHDGAADPYAASRDFYLQRRQAEIDHLRGRPNRITGLDPASAAARLAPASEDKAVPTEPDTDPEPAPVPVPAPVPEAATPPAPVAAPAAGDATSDPVPDEPAAPTASTDQRPEGVESAPGGH